MHQHGGTERTIESWEQAAVLFLLHVFSHVTPLCIVTEGVMHGVLFNVCTMHHHEQGAVICYGFTSAHKKYHCTVLRRGYAQGDGIFI